MKIKTDGKYEYRLDDLREAMQITDENTKAGAIDRALEFHNQMLRENGGKLRLAVEHKHMTPELAELLTTTGVKVVYQFDGGIEL